MQNLGDSATVPSRPRTAMRLRCELRPVDVADSPDHPPELNMVAYTGQPMDVEDWGRVVLDVGGLTMVASHVPIRLQHASDKGIGHADRILRPGNQIIVHGWLSRDTEAAREVLASARKGFPWQASVGLHVNKTHSLRAGNSETVGGVRLAGPLLVVDDAVIEEISVVEVGADKNTSVTIAAKAAELGGTHMVDEVAAKDKDKSTETAEESLTAGKAAAGEQTDTVSTATVKLTADTSQLRTDMAAELKRIEAVRKICDGYPDLVVKAVEEGWDETRAELEALRASRPQIKVTAGDAGISGNEDLVLEAACCLSGRLSNVEKQYPPQVLEAAHKRFRGRLGLEQLLFEAACNNGYTGRYPSDTRALLAHAFSGRDRGNLQAQGWSHTDISGILSNVANKFLLDGFGFTEQAWRAIAAIRPVNDFKTATSYRMTGVNQFQQIPPGGEIKHGTLGETAYTNKADDHGLMLSLTRQDIINDDLGALTQAPSMLGRGAGLQLNEVFWTAFMDNAAFFTALRGNYQEGAGALSVLSIDGLTAGELLCLNQTDPDGKPLGVNPAILLVPPALSVVAAQLMKSLELRDTNATTKYPVNNPHAGKFETVVSRYLSNATITGNSTTAWYLLANPADLAAIEVAFLFGQEAPTIETADADFSVLGIQMRAYFAFGVALQEYRAGMKSKGAA